MDETDTVNTIRAMEREFNEITGHNAFLNIEQPQSRKWWRFTDETYVKPEEALAHMESLLQIARSGDADRLLWW